MPNDVQDGLHLDVSPDNGEGGRMSYIRLDDTADGIAVSFQDVPEPGGGWVRYEFGTLSRDVPHTIKFWIKLNPGPDNDRVGIYIDGRSAGQCFTTWENSTQPVPISDRLLFRSTATRSSKASSVTASCSTT